jgi:hypothetical protein
MEQNEKIICQKKINYVRNMEQNAMFLMHSFATLVKTWLRCTWLR